MDGNRQVEDDGPLFRATLSSLELDLASLQAGVKGLIKSADALLRDLLSVASHQESIDSILGQLSKSKSNTSPLDNCWQKHFEQPRTLEAESRLGELRQLKQLMQSLSTSMERLKSVEGQAHKFQADAKLYYSAVSKYLATPSNKATEGLDQKQAQKTAAFTLARQEYLGFLQGLLSAEETVIFNWLTEWVTRIANFHPTPQIPSLSTPPQLEPGPGSGFSFASSSSSTSEFTVDCPEWVPPTKKLGGLRGFLKSHLSPLPTATSPVVQLHAHNSAYSLASISTLPSSTASSPALISATQVSPSLSLATPRPKLSPRKREGFLWATKSPMAHATPGDGGGGWHKFWMVLSNGQLTEYTDWKRQLTVHNTPIDLRYASVTSCATGPTGGTRHSERRFCFQVLTPQERRLYQATSQVESDEWVAAITRAVESLLMGNSSVRVFDASKITAGVAGQRGEGVLSLRAFASISSPSLTSGHEDGRDPPVQRGLGTFTALSHRLLGRRVSTGGAKKHLATPIHSARSRASFDSHRYQDPAASPILVAPRRPFASGGAAAVPTLPSLEASPPRTSPHSSPSSTLSEADQHIAHLVNHFAQPFQTQLSPETKRAQKLKNGTEIANLARDAGGCAECGKADPDWASYNLGIFLCIRCSGIHRSLGTHISKVRSIALDDWSDEQMHNMREMGNTKSNAFFEATRDKSIIIDDESIGDFIRHKYATRDFVRSFEPGQLIVDPLISTGPSLLDLPRARPVSTSALPEPGSRSLGTPYVSTAASGTAGDKV